MVIFSAAENRHPWGVGNFVVFPKHPPWGVGNFVAFSKHPLGVSVFSRGEGFFPHFLGARLFEIFVGK